MKTPEELAAEKAAADAAARAQADEAIKRAAFDEGFRAGAEAERKRIQAVEEQAFPGHDKLVAEMKFDGKTTGPEAAVRILAAEKTRNRTRAEDLRNDAPPPAPHIAAERGTPERPGAVPASDDPVAVEASAKNEWMTKPALRREFTSEAAFVAFKKAEAQGQVKILSKKAS